MQYHFTLAFSSSIPDRIIEMYIELCQKQKSGLGKGLERALRRKTSSHSQNHLLYKLHHQYMPTCNTKNLSQEPISLHGVRLGLGDSVDHQTQTTLGDDVGRAVPNLDRNNCLCSANSHHWEKVDHWVCAPADHGDHLGILDQCCNFWIRLCVGCVRQANKECVDNEHEAHHGPEPAHPEKAQIALNDQFTWVTHSDHHSGNKAECPAFR